MQLHDGFQEQEFKRGGQEAHACCMATAALPVGASIQ
jgi:hypothetical protein